MTGEERRAMKRDQELMLEILSWARSEMEVETGRPVPPMTVRDIEAVTGIKRGTVFNLEKRAMERMKARAERARM